ncbi:hypothetical protein GGR06_002750 [Bacteroides reticulotermitis]|uniref:Nuclear transport factor 2 family protein n=1 Tax=Bacteroides reticulotermitis TaxID=1133319 RepID=A0A840D3F0_9BACE|nr:hypothetical protein [Bacteroides reticulotermitis]MBB4044948.1 hypothetical protein [Bacteroides reticulotermitis]HJD74557.1 hypothetical protein [Bacteroides reticulotermitis]
MKRIYLIVLVLSLFHAFPLLAQDAVQLVIRDGIEGGMKSKIENTSTALLSEINSAFKQNRSLNTAQLNMTQQAREGLAALWENVHFYCDDSEVVQSCLNASGGYQVRQIPLMLRPDDNSATADDEYQEGVINFDRNGTITRFNLTIGTNIYQNVMKRGQTVQEVERRQQILSYVEHFRTAYNEKDLPFLDRIFSDDALIITGTVTKVKKTDGSGITYNKVSYKKQGKQEYLSRLKTSFAANKYINVRFDDVKVVKHPTKEGFYGVTVHQLYSNSSGYSDDGYLFLLWDFRDSNNVQIHVRTWQPRFVGDAELPKEDIFTAGDFEIEL